MTFRELRERHGYPSGAKLAKHAGLDQTTISQLDQGKIADPRYSTLEAIAAVLDLSIGAVMRSVRQSCKKAA